MMLKPHENGTSSSKPHENGTSSSFASSLTLRPALFPPPSLLTLPSLGLACFVLFSVGGQAGGVLKSDGVEKKLVGGPAYGYSLCK